MSVELERMTAPELRSFAKAKGIRITYLSERKKEDLLRLIRAALESTAEAK